MAEETDEVTVGVPLRMDGVRLPRRLTKADVPGLSDRVRVVWNTNGQYRSSGERAVHIAALAAVIVVSTFIWASGASVAHKVTDSLAVLVVALLVATPVLLKIRFRS
jgi:hypothetical protein